MDIADKLDYLQDNPNEWLPTGILREAATEIRRLRLSPSQIDALRWAHSMAAYYAKIADSRHESRGVYHDRRDALDDILAKEGK
jgi:Mg2+/Co2+ transporter CorC